MILEGEIKDTKMSSFSSDFQTFIRRFKISFVFSLWIINEFEKSHFNQEEILKTDNGSDHSWHSKMFAIDYLGTRKFWVTNIKQRIEAFSPYSWNPAKS